MAAILFRPQCVDLIYPDCPTQEVSCLLPHQNKHYICWLLSNFLYKWHQIPKLKCFSSPLAKSVEARTSFENEDVVGAVLTGSPNTSVINNFIAYGVADSTHNSQHYSVSPIYRGRVYRGIGYIAVACWTPFFGAQERDIFREIAVTPWTQFAEDNFSRNLLTAITFVPSSPERFFSRNQLWPTCQCGLEHMLCDGQPSSAEHWHLHCIAE